MNRNSKIAIALWALVLLNTSLHSFEHHDAEEHGAKPHSQLDCQFCEVSKVALQGSYSAAILEEATVFFRLHYTSNINQSSIYRLNARAPPKI